MKWNRQAAGLLLAGLLAFTGLSSAASAADRPTVTLIIDDMGYGLEQARRALALPRPFAVAILPDTPYATRIARAAHAQETDVILHLPMTGNSVRPPDAYTMHYGLGEQAMGRRLDDALARVPGAIAINNHEGSRTTATPAAMQRFMSVLSNREHVLAFVDSRTTADSVAAAHAVAAGVRTASRDVFLDHERDAGAIDRAVDHWIEIAEETGCALAIGHPHPETLAVLAARLRELDLKVERVGLLTYIDRCGTNATP